LKINSPDIVHKSDSGGVKLSLNNSTEVKKAYDEILKKVKKQYPEAAVHGVSVQKMVRPARSRSLFVAKAGVANEMIYSTNPTIEC